jgi:UDP-N-acetyl-D-glucosamine dehydrogenase
LGAAYKKDIDDDRESPSYVIMELLSEHGAEIFYNDPYIPKLKPSRKHDFKLESVPLTEEGLQSMDAAIIITDHSDYDYDWIVEHTPLVIDTRNATKNVQDGREKIFKA